MQEKPCGGFYNKLLLYRRTLILHVALFFLLSLREAVHLTCGHGNAVVENLLYDVQCNSSLRECCT